MLLLNVSYNRVPAAVIVDKIAIAGGVNNVEPQPDIILFDNVRDGLDIGSLANGLVRRKSALGVNQVRRKDGVDERRLAKTSLTLMNLCVRAMVGVARRWPNPWSRRLLGANSPTQITLN